MLFDEHLVAAELHRVRQDTSHAMIRHAYALREQPMLRDSPITAPRWFKPVHHALSRLVRTVRRAATPPAVEPEAARAAAPMTIPPK
jgi:hypothetical protein